MLTIDSVVSDLYPGTQMGILAMQTVDAAAPPPPELVSQAMEKIRSRYGHLDRAALKALYPIKSYVDYYRSFGYSYHVLGQLESILSGKQAMTSASGLLSVMFLTELESMILTAGHDLDTLKVPLRLTASTVQEQFKSISGKEVTTVLSDLMVVSDHQVISSILRGPDLGSRITPKTTSVLFTLYAPPGVEKSAVDSALHMLEARIRSVSAASQTLSLSVYPHP
ncbi:MAG TPA: hypothetical protein PKU80_01450 [Candidatus Limiplasma sp.]|nr:hypothetical protein [Candidatus Limiplasma sp.]HRX08542.1 hypothetical protein [Candidatus Limiplasma sp.]